MSLKEFQEKAKSEDFKNIKLNVVLQGGVNDDEIGDFINLTKNNDYIADLCIESYSSIILSRVTLARIEAAAIELDLASPLIIGIFNSFLSLISKLKEDI